MIVVPTDLHARIIDTGEIERVKKACLNELLRSKSAKDALWVIDELVHFCELLSKPENHVLVTTGRSIEKEVKLQSVLHMRGEMAQELIGLDPFTAYINIVDIKDEGQRLVKGKIRTLKLPMAEMREVVRERYDRSMHNSLSYCRRRNEIEEEIRQRRERWAGVVSDKPPPRIAGRGESRRDGPPPRSSQTPPE